MAILILISIVSVIIGIFLFFRAVLSIEIQRRFYERINWRIEPVSMQKEIRNTKIMGFFLVVLGIMTFVSAILIK